MTIVKQIDGPNLGYRYVKIGTQCGHLFQELSFLMV